MNALARLLKTPSAFPADPRGYLENQTGHAYIVGGGLAYTGLPLVVILIGYLLWEAVQWWWYDALLWDCLEDTAHVMIVACAVRYLLPMLVVVQLLFMAAGYLQRTSIQQTKP